MAGAWPVVPPNLPGSSTYKTPVPAADPANKPNLPASPIGNPIDWLNQFNVIFRPTWWARVGIFALGFLMIWWAVLIFIASNKNVQGAVLGTAKNLAAKTPQGMAANAATGALL